MLALGRSAAGPAGQVEADPYGQWNQAFARFDPELRRRLTQRVDLLTHRPRFSVVMSAYNTDRRFLAEAIDSVLDQIYPDFELVVADDASSDPGVAEVVAAAAARDSRVRYVRRDDNGGIAAATNTAIGEAGFEWLVFMDHDDTLAPWALLHVALAIARRPGAQLLYSDEDKLDERGRLFMPYFKSDFDPLLLLGQNYVCHLTTVRRDLVDAPRRAAQRVRRVPGLGPGAARGRGASTARTSSTSRSSSTTGAATATRRPRPRRPSPGPWTRGAARWPRRWRAAGSRRASRRSRAPGSPGCATRCPRARRWCR